MKKFRLYAVLLFSSIVPLTIASVNMFGQQSDSTVEWKLSLQDLEHRLAGVSKENPTGIEAWRADADSLRNAIASFASEHPEMEIAAPDRLPEKPGVEELARQLNKLTEAVNQVIKQNPGSPFHLGTATVVVAADASAPSLVSDSIDHSQIAQHNFLNIAKAFDYLPGVEIEHIAPRNEAGLRVRGFTTRGQVPFYVDGIPISVPYDGYVDFNRFLTGDIAQLQVTKGYSSPLLGPNALGGTINLVTNEPVKKFEGEALLGTGSGNNLLSGLRLGSRQERFFAQGSFDWLQADFVPLSGNFQVNQYTRLPDIAMTDHLNHSSTLDNRYTARLGWTPRGEDEYVFSVITQKGEKSVPLYQGSNTAAAFNRFWSWPFWDMNSYYFHSKTGIGETSSINFRGFYNQFKNAIDMYSNDQYVMNTASAQRSVYNEHTDGASSQFETRILSKNVISGALFFKDDTHREYGVFPVRSPFPFIEPQLLDRDQQTSIGLQDVLMFTARIRATVGFSADHYNGLQGEFYNSAQTGFLPFVCLSSPTNTSVAGCTLHAWNYNPQAAVSAQIGKSGSLFFTVANRGRFPMLKDIYSAGLGSALPNPNLKAEHSQNWNIGYSNLVFGKTLFQFELFRSNLHDAIESVAVTDPGNPNASLTPPAGALCPSSTNGFCSQMVNIGNEVHEGVEFKVRSAPTPRVTIDAGYSYLNRTIAYDFTNNPTVSQVRTSVVVLPPLPRNKLTGTATVRAIHNTLGIFGVRYEGGLTLQDTTYATTSPLSHPYGEALATVDLGGVVPIYKQATIQIGVRNLLDRNYFYVAGFPEAGRNWFLNMRYQF